VERFTNWLGRVGETTLSKFSGPCTHRSLMSPLIKALDKVLLEWMYIYDVFSWDLGLRRATYILSFWLGLEITRFKPIYIYRDAYYYWLCFMYTGCEVC